MAYSLVFSDEFEDDLDAIIDYHLNNLFAPQAARTLLATLDDAIDLIHQFPTINAISNKLLLHEKGYREQFVRNYVVIYSFDGSIIHVLRMFHLTQDFASLLEK